VPTRLVVGALRATAMASKLLLALYLGRAFDPSALGTYGLFASTSAFALSLVGLEYHQHAVRELLQSPERRGSIVLSQVRVYAAMYLVVPLLVGPLFIASGMPNFCAGFLAIVIPAAHISQETQRLLTALSRPILAYVVNATANGLWVVPVLAMAVFNPSMVGLKTVFGAWAVGASLGALLGVSILVRMQVLRGARWRDSAPNWRGIRTGLVFLASALCVIAIDTVDRYALEWLRSTAEVGVYTFHANIARAHRDILFVVAVAPVLPALVAMPRGAALDAAARATAARLARGITIASAVLAVALGVGIHVALAIARRPELSQHIGSFYWLLGGNLVTGLSTAAHYGLYAARHDAAIVRSHAAGLLIAVALSAACVPAWGVTGAAVANCLAYCAIAWLKYRAYAGVYRSEQRSASFSV
jgi:hypothetical protein